MPEWAADYINIAETYLADDEYDRLYTRHPELPRGVDDGCPTCKGERKFLWQDNEHQCDCRTQLALHKHYLLANIPELYQRLDWPDFQGDEKARDIVHQYLRKHGPYIGAGMGLFLHGQPGTGKSLLAAFTAKELVKLGYGVHFMTAEDAKNLVSKGFSDLKHREWFERRVVESKVLVIDDLGKEFRTKTEFNRTMFDHIIRQRTGNLRPTCLTTNMTKELMIKEYGDPLYSLMMERSLPRYVTGADYRGQASNRAIKEIERGWVRPIF